MAPKSAASPRTQGLIAINLAAVIFGSAALYGKLDVSPFWIVAARAAFAAAALFLFRSDRKNFPFPPRGLRFPAILTGVVLAIHWLAFFASVQLSGVAVATLTFATFPLFTVLIEAFHRQRTPGLIEIGAGLTIIVAVGLLVSPGADLANLPGATAGLGSALTYAIFWHAGRGLRDELAPRAVAFWQNAIAAAFLVPFLFFASPSPHTVLAWVWLALLGAVNTALMLQLYLYALRRISASTCSGFVALEPVYAILFAALFFREPVTLWIVLSAALIIGSSFALLRLESSP